MGRAENQISNSIDDMESGLNNHFKRLASELFIKYKSDERKRIDRSLDQIIGRLDDYFDNEMDEAIVFGSYSRDTILPRVCDNHSDIDILVQFNTGDFQKLKPESYRNKLRQFALKHYPRSPVVKDHPSIVLELDHIKFDLVPSIFDKGFFYDSIEIPSKDGGWMETEPDKFNEELINANTRYGSIVKPIIRLLKYWNANNEYPYYSFELEKMIAEMNFRNDNYESGFFYAVKNLSDSGLPGWAERKVDSLKETCQTAREHLDDEDVYKAKCYISKVLPGISSIV